MMNGRKTTPRRGFTLVEILVVIAIIGILVGLLTPALMGAYRRARVATAQAQVDVLAIGLESFKAEYGSYPPSRLVFHESGWLGTPPADGGLYYASFPRSSEAPSNPNIGGRPDGPEAGSVEHRALVNRSLIALRSLFPRIAVRSGAWDGKASTVLDGGYDLNGNGVIDELPILLDGHECLALFIGGRPNWNGSVASGFELTGVLGLSRDPRNPFRRVSSLGTVEGNRVGPFVEINSPDKLADDDNDGMPGLLDMLGVGAEARYIAYFSADHGGYDPRDCRLEDASIANFSISAAGAITSIGPNPWSVSKPSTTVPTQWYRATTYQLLSPGLDRTYGAGGRIELSGPEATYPGDLAMRQAEEDNVGLR